MNCLKVMFIELLKITGELSSLVAPPHKNTRLFDVIAAE
jgi:hypothetical protein